MYPKKNTICELLPIDYPIIQAGMVWVSGGKLAAASANAGILGIIGAGSMAPELLAEHIKKAQALTTKPQALAVNIPLLYSKVEQQVETALENGIKIFFTSAGSPKKFTQYLKDHNCTVVHVTSSALLAKKCEDAGVDAIVAEGFEAGGHNGRDETTSLVLIPQVCDAVKIPVIAAGGFASGRSVAAAFALGAAGVQIGTRFVAAIESSAHQNFKQAVVDANEGDTELSMKELVPVRLLKNQFYQQIKDLESRCAGPEEIKTLLGKGRARKGMLEGDLKQGELEIGQVSAQIHDIRSVHDIVEQIHREYQLAVSRF